MMTGEMEYDSYMIPQNLNEENPLFYPESTLIMFVLFVIVVPIVFMNLLVSLNLGLFWIDHSVNVNTCFLACDSVTETISISDLFMINN